MVKQAVPKTGWLTTTETYPLTVLEAEVWDWGGRVLPASSRLQVFFRAISPQCVAIFSSLCLLLFCFERSPVIVFRAHLNNPGWSHLKTLVNYIFQVKLHSQVLGVRSWTYLLGGPSSDPFQEFSLEACVKTITPFPHITQVALHSLQYFHGDSVGSEAISKMPWAWAPEPGSMVRILRLSLTSCMTVVIYFQ